MFSAVGRVSARRIFGGHGLKCEGLGIRLIAFDTLDLKVDAPTVAAFEKAGEVPFRYETAPGKFNEMSYWMVSPDAMESAAEMTHWARLARAASLRAAQKAVRATAKVSRQKHPKLPQSAPQV